MRKLLVPVLALVTLFSIAAPAWATEVELDKPMASSVDIKWDGIRFEYSDCPDAEPACRWELIGMVEVNAKTQYICPTDQANAEAAGLRQIFRRAKQGDSTIESGATRRSFGTYAESPHLCWYAESDDGTSVPVGSQRIPLGSPAEVGIASPGCGRLAAGKPGDTGDILRVRTASWSGIVLYRHGRQILVFMTDGTYETNRWRKTNLQPLRCSGERATVGNLDRIQVRVGHSWAEGLVVDQSGKGVRVGKPAERRYEGAGGLFAPGASGDGIRIGMQGQSKKRDSAAPLVIAGGDQDNVFKYERKRHLINAASGLSSRRTYDLLRGFNASDLLTFSGAGKDLVNATDIREHKGDIRMRNWVWAGTGNDRILGHEGKDMLIRGGAGDDFILGGAGNDGDDEGNGYGLQGGKGDDRIYAGDGQDSIEGGKGRDTIFAGAGFDEIYTRDGKADTINCGPGNKMVVQFDWGIDRIVNCRKSDLER